MFIQHNAQPKTQHNAQPKTQHNAQPKTASVLDLADDMHRATETLSVQTSNLNDALDNFEDSMKSFMKMFREMAATPSV